MNLIAIQLKRGVRIQMSESRAQQELEQLILLVALSFCFHSEDTYLLEEHIFTRGFTPLMDYNKSCIKKLIDYGSVEFKIVDPEVWSCDDANSLFIKSPVKDGSSLERFVYENAEKTIALLNRSSDFRVYLRDFHREIMRCECIEYANFYAEKEGFKMVSANYNNIKLNLLSLDISPEKINALLWRSIKSLTKKNDSKEFLEFDNVIDFAFNAYVKYKRSNVDFEGYQRPKVLQLSMLSKILELYMGVAKAIERA